MRYLLLAGMALFFTNAKAEEIKFEQDLVLEQLTWNSDDTFDLNLRYQQVSTEIHGTLHTGESSKVTSDDGAFVVALKSYTNHYLTITAVPAHQEVGFVFVLGMQGDKISLLSPFPIHGSAAALLSTVDGTDHSEIEDVIAALSSNGRMSSDGAFKTVVDYFKRNPDKLVSDFYDQVELGNINSPAEAPEAVAASAGPVPAGAQPGSPAALGLSPSGAASATVAANAAAPPKIRHRVHPQQPPQPPNPFGIFLHMLGGGGPQQPGI